MPLIPIIIIGMIYLIILKISDFIVKNFLIIVPILVVLTAVLTLFYLNKKEKSKKQAEEIEKQWIKEREIREKYERELYEKRKTEREEIEKREKEKFNAMQVADIDSMTGLEFEAFLQKILTALYYQVNLTTASNDFGVDLVAIKGDDKIAIQAKRQQSKVSRRAISDAVAGMRHYNCTKAMVITNNEFSKGALQFAQSTNCLLINRDKLANLIIAAQNASRTKE